MKPKQEDKQFFILELLNNPTFDKMLDTYKQRPKPECKCERCKI